MQTSLKYHVTTEAGFHSVHEAHPLLECTRVQDFYSISLPLKFPFSLDFQWIVRDALLFFTVERWIAP
jgi:hypothetical protein